MNFRNFLLAATLAALPLVPAHATITYTAVSADAGDPGQPGGTIIDNFGNIRAPETSYYITGSGVVTCSAITGDTADCNSSIGSPPQINGQNDTGGPPGVTGNYLAVNTGATNNPGNVGFFQISGLSGLNNVSFDWGSVDDWNFVQLLDAQGNLLENVQGTALGATFDNGTPFSPGSMRLTFDWDSSDPVAILQFGDAFGPAFEVANVSTVNSSAVPEPGSIALLAAGLGAIGLTRRQRRAVRSTS